MCCLEVLNSIHKTTSLDPVFLKDLTKFSNPILANMWTYFAIGTISFPNFSSIFLYFGDLNSIDGFDSRRFRAILWLIAGGTRGGPNRIRILNLLRTKSLNAHQISKELDLDHKTVKHHIDVLVKNSLIAKSEDIEYGANYCLTSIMTKNISALEEIVSKIREQ